MPFSSKREILLRLKIFLFAHSFFALWYFPFSAIWLKIFLCTILWALYSLFCWSGYWESSKIKTSCSPSFPLIWSLKENLRCNFGLNNLDMHATKSDGLIIQILFLWFDKFKVSCFNYSYVFMLKYLFEVSFGSELGGCRPIKFYLTFGLKLMESTLSTNYLVCLISSQMKAKTSILHSSNGLGLHHSYTSFPMSKNLDV